MLKRYLVLFFFLVAPLLGETIGDVEYHLPRMFPEWVVGFQHETAKATVRKYVPPIPEGEKVSGVCYRSDESFGVAYSNEPTPPFDSVKIEETFSKIMGMPVEIWTLKQSDHDLLFEWKGVEEGQEAMHGWVRLFPRPNGLVQLMYQTERLADLEKARSTWLPVLQNAHIRN